MQSKLSLIGHQALQHRMQQTFRDFSSSELAFYGLLEVPALEWGTVKPRYNDIVISKTHVTFLGIFRGSKRWELVIVIRTQRRRYAL